jgi:hypothetical protein
MKLRVSELSPFSLPPARLEPCFFKVLDALPFEDFVADEWAEEILSLALKLCE